MAENSRSGLFLFSLLQLITLGCLIFVIANNKYELKSVQAELKQMQEEKIKSRSENVLGENADSYQSKMHMKSVHLNKRSAQQYESVSSMLFDALSVWFGGSPIQPVIKCTVDQSNQTKCSFHSASQEENEAAHAAAVLMEEAISRVFEERMEANLNSSSEGESKTKCVQYVLVYTANYNTQLKNEPFCEVHGGILCNKLLVFTYNIISISYLMDILCLWLRNIPRVPGGHELVYWPCIDTKWSDSTGCFGRCP